MAKKSKKSKKKFIVKAPSNSQTAHVIPESKMPDIQPAQETPVKEPRPTVKGSGDPVMDKTQKQHRPERFAAAAQRVPHLAALSSEPRTAKLYMWFSLLVLLGTTAYWSFLGAHVHADNADQLANSFLFQNGGVFQHALWPDQHSFFIKWPIFWLMQLFGSSATVFTASTIACSVLTVMALAFMLYRIERRALPFGTLCLAMASVLLLIPAQPYPGGILPVNMAMVTTRNLEYVVFISSLILLARSRRWWNWGFFGSIGLMGMLVASDKLFLVLSVAGALLATVWYSLLRRWPMVKTMFLWLVSSLLAGALAFGILRGIEALHITGVAQSAATGPYSVTHGLKGIALGGAYLVLGLFTNLGANPADDTRLLGQLPREAWESLGSVHGIGFMVNAVIALAGLGAIGYAIWKSGQKPVLPKQKKKSEAVIPEHNLALDVTIMLIATTVAAAAAFVASSHYYPVDARYVTIAFFTVFIALATYTRSRERLRPGLVIIAGVVILASICAGIGMAKNNFDQEKTAMRNTHDRNSRIVGALHSHKVDVLVGDYWRVLPIKLESKGPLTTMPMSACTQARDILSSTDWQPDLKKHSFAYILSLDKSLTNYPPCSLQEIVSKYGLPNASTVIEGSLRDPRELLLFYDHGAGSSAPKISSSQARSATVTPISITDLPHTQCTQPTVMNIVAHQDDDLLFMSPDLLHDVKAGNCIRTVYITAGDAGGDKFYWLGREKGSETAYSRMLGLASNTLWLQRIVKLPTGQFVTVANPVGNPRISLIFMHLPDGNLRGQGFAASHFESLASLDKGRLEAIHSVDQQSSYTASQLTAALETILRTYQPNELRTQAEDSSHRYPDHSDHIAAGHFADRAFQAYQAQFAEHVTKPLAHYQGYPIHDRPANVQGDELTEKQNVFFEYAHFDGSACSSVESCHNGTAYEAYLKRQYQQ